MLEIDDVDPARLCRRPPMAAAATNDEEVKVEADLESLLRNFFFLCRFARQTKLVFVSGKILSG
jgi:hypothetical protein